MHMTQNSKDLEYTHFKKVICSVPFLTLSPKHSFPFSGGNHFYTFSASPFRNILFVYKHIHSCACLCINACRQTHFAYLCVSVNSCYSIQWLKITAIFFMCDSVLY